MTIHEATAAMLMRPKAGSGQPAAPCSAPS